jgi:predicted kinase
LVILVGLPGSGKSTLAQRFAATHAVVSSDVLRGPGDPRARRDAAIRAALAAGHSVAVDAVNGAVATRARLLELARTTGARAVAYYLDVPRAVCLARNRARPAPARVPDVAIYAAAARLVPPRVEESFERVVWVRRRAAGVGWWIVLGLIIVALIWRGRR